MTSTLSGPVANGFPLTSLAGVAVGAGDSTTFDVSLAGIGYLLDNRDAPGLRFFSAQRIRQQADNSNRPGEASLNPEGPWRRSFRSWHQGAGQTHVDRDDSLASRFNTSKGLDVWTEWQLQLLNTTTLSRASTETNLAMAVAGTRLYVMDGGEVRYTTDPAAGTPTYTACTSHPTNDGTGMASTGTYVFTAHGSDGLYITNTGTGAMAQYDDNDLDDVHYAKGRIIAFNGGAVWNPVGSYTSGLPHTTASALYTHPDPGWAWVDAAEGLNHIYLAGRSGGGANDKSIIYRTEVKADGSALDVPIVAGTLPDGEVVQSIYGYLEWLCIGTTKGVRLAVQDANGNLAFGRLIETGATVRSFEGQGQYVWFTWENYDAADTGLGRLDLTTFTSTLTPAYASDIMYSTATVANVESVVTFADRRLFAVQGVGFVVEDTSERVGSGSIDLGLVDYGIDSSLLSDFVLTHEDFNTSPQSGSIGVTATTDGTADVLGTALAGTMTSLTANEAAGSAHGIALSFTKGASDGPVLTSLVARSYPQSDSTRFIDARLIVSATVLVESGYATMQPADILSNVEALHADQIITRFQSLGTGYTVLVDDYEFTTISPDQRREGWSGTLSLRMKRV